MHALAPLATAGLLLPLAPVGVDDNPSKDPREADPGEVYQWTAADGLKYEYYVPEDYDPEAGANLTVVFHGNGLDHRWTFWNHPAGEFREDDIVVSPDGTTPHSGTGANEFLQSQRDLERVHAFLEEMKSIWNVDQTFLYGHSQGSFFVYLYAGAYPEEVDGVCSHAGGVWIGTQQSRKAHHQAIGVLHGTDDHIPYSQGAYAREWYRDAKYPHVHLRTLFDWPHRPHHFQAESVLAWCEGVTSDDPDRVARCLDHLAQPKLPMGADWSALWEVAQRLSEMEGASDDQRERGAELAAAVVELGEEHVEEILDGLGKKGLREYEGGEWVGVLIRFLEDFHGTPPHDAFVKKHGKVLEDVRETGVEARAEVFDEAGDDPDAAFAAAMELLRSGYLDYKLLPALDAVEELVDDDRVRARRRDLAAFERLAKEFRKGRERGFAGFVRRNERVKLR